MNELYIQIISSLATSYIDCNNKVLKDFYVTAIKDILILLDIDPPFDQYNELVSKDRVAMLPTNRNALEKEIKNIFGCTLEEYKIRILGGHINAYINAKNSKIKSIEKDVVKDMIKILG